MQLSCVLLLVYGCCCLAVDPTLTVLSHAKDSRDNVEVQAGGTVVLKCQGERNISWYMPEVAPNTTIRFQNGRQSLSYELTPRGCNGTPPEASCFSSTITLANLVANDTGLVECRYADDSITGGASVFLFVSEPDAACLKLDRTIVVTPGDPLTLPCITTSSTATARINTLTSSAYTYDRRRGAIITRATLALAQKHMCICTKQGVMHVILFLLQFNVTIQPQVRVLTGNGRSMFYVGERVEIQCDASLPLGQQVTFGWLFPQQQWQPSRIVLRTPPGTDTGGTSGTRDFTSTLIINGTVIKDTGAYTCLAANGANQQFPSPTIFITVTDTPFVNFTDFNANVIEVDPGASEVELGASVTALPEPQFFWIWNGFQLQSGSKYHISSSQSDNGYHYGLTIFNLQPDDAGNYTLVVTAASKDVPRVFTLVLNALPAVDIDPSGFVYQPALLPSEASATRRITLKCKATGVPVPDFAWLWQPCNASGCLELSSWANVSEGRWNQNSPSVDMRNSWESQLSVAPRHPGVYRCIATNKLGSAAATTKLLVGDTAEALSFVGNDRLPKRVAVGDVVTFTCSANRWLFKEPSLFLKLPGSNDNVAISGQERCCTITKSSTQFSHLITILINASLNDTADYGCEAENITHKGTFLAVGLFRMTVDMPVPPKLVIGLPGDRQSMAAGSTRSFACSAAGFPEPKMSWSKNGKPVLVTLGGGVSISADSKNLTIERAQLSDAGSYTCMASSRLGVAFSNMTLTITAAPLVARLSDTNIAIIVVIIILIIAGSVVTTVFLVRRYCRKKAIPIEFLLPSKNMLNPDIPIDEQTDCLPYDAEWEFPRENLKFGMVLGQGAFGRVVKADAFGIEPGVTVTTVAVKTIRDPDDIEQIKALVSELKILIHLGQHLNIVNLLGAVTRRLKRGELYVIVEYCRYGNLRSYLLKHKSHFEDVLDEESKKALAVRLSTRRSVLQSVSGGDASDDYLNSSSRSQMHCEENPLTTLDLIYWTYQIARGMQYLASIQYIHRDLAARNVLLCDDNIVKICDFGLAKDIYKYHEYRKKTDGPLPIKWMALESLTHKLFTTASDVWSFGVTAWELFSLAATPYPSVELNEAFLEKLSSGYRMEQPKHSPNDVYQLMLKCWHPDPLKRPTFADLATELSALLSEDVKEHYLSLEEPYTRKRDAREDYSQQYNKAGAGDSDYLPVLPVATAPLPPSAAAASDYYNVTKSKVSSEKGTTEETIPLSLSMVADQDSHEVFEGEDIPLPTCVAPSPSPLEVERYTKMQHLAKERASAMQAAQSVTANNHAQPNSKVLLLPQRANQASGPTVAAKIASTTETTM